MKKSEKVNFYLGALFFTLAVFSVSFLPLYLRKIDLIYLYSPEQLKYLSVIFGFFAVLFWFNTDKFFKSQLLYSGLLAAFFIISLIYNKFAIFP